MKKYTGSTVWLCLRVTQYIWQVMWVNSSWVSNFWDFWCCKLVVSSVKWMSGMWNTCEVSCMMLYWMVNKDGLIQCGVTASGHCWTVLQEESKEGAWFWFPICAISESYILRICSDIYIRYMADHPSRPAVWWYVQVSSLSLWLDVIM